MFLQLADTLKLSILMPRYDGEPQLVAVPLSTTMGWVSSPPTFCAASETTAHLANASLYMHTQPSHRLEGLASIHDCWEAPRPAHLNGQGSPGPSTIDEDMPSLHRRELTQRTSPSEESPLFGDSIPPDRSQRLANNAPTCLRPLPQPRDRPPLHVLPGPLAHVNVFIDDFIGLAQGSKRRCQNVWQCILHAVDRVFSEQTPNTLQQKEAVSERKLAKGDGGWSRWKEVLRWNLDTERGTLELTAHRKDRIRDIFQSLRGQNRIGVKAWQRVLGELRFMGPTIPGSAGLFGALQLGFTHSDKHRVRITPHLRDHLHNFEALAHDVSQRPTLLAEIMHS